MATSLQNLSSYEIDKVPSGKDLRFGIVVAEWNSDITTKLVDGAYDTLLKFDVSKENIIIKTVPGSFELTYGAKLLIEKANIDAVIILGCVILGDTPHFTFVCESVTQGVTELNLRYNVPVIFGLITTNTMEQAEARSGGNLGNKGDEAAVTALKMASLNRKY